MEKLTIESVWLPCTHSPIRPCTRRTLPRPAPPNALQVLDLLEAVEGLKIGIMNGDGVALDKVEEAVGRVAGGIDVYLILAVRGGGG